MRAPPRSRGHGTRTSICAHLAMEMEGSPLSRISSAQSASSPHGVDPPSRQSHAPATGGYRTVLFIPRPPHATAHTAMLFCCSQTAAPALAHRAEARSSWWLFTLGDYAFLPVVALCTLLRLSPRGCRSAPTSNQLIQQHRQTWILVQCLGKKLWGRKASRYSI
ncbi:uncharacterized protein LOC119303792 isoform X1 [Triticum dicoccoides]|uniref:uncharacterized protein LOC119303792 isoform X1 n=1 Tax=Triticum dicoccoides TaxID=85692 RepID=UPI00189020B4|nr:uncharacterized protein LOC119303792 isoform X1 [Triticum dicoccoides]XP_044383679.1 uncharacterized protein LOC123105644 isoform X1 [Triticum aestivum]